MKLNPSEISALIKEQIKGYENLVESSDVGTVIAVGDGIATIYGLKNAMLGELLLFPNDVYGMVMNLNLDDGRAVVGGAIVDADDLEVGQCLREQRAEALVEVVVGVVYGYYN